MALDCFAVSDDEESKLERVDIGGVEKSLVRLFRLDRAYAIAILPHYDSKMILPHGGICDLPGESHFQFVQ